MAKPRRKSKPRQKSSDPRLLGLFYSIDPSSGSKESSAAISVWRGGVLQEVIEIKVPVAKLERRLHALAKALMEMEKPDAVAIEKIPPYIKTGKFTTVNLSLHKSVGVFASVWGDGVWLEIPIISWKQYAKICKGYNKTDCWDSVMIGVTALREGGYDVDLESLSERLDAEGRTEECSS